MFASFISKVPHVSKVKTAVPKVRVRGNIERAVSRLVKKQYDNMHSMRLFELQEELVKRLIRDTIETYSGQWRLIHEAVQNAHDSIQRNDAIEKGLIEIRLAVASNSVTVKDNGTGIAIEKFHNIFLIGGSDKEADLKRILKGSQGVGIKSTLFTSTFFKVETVCDGYTWRYELEDCFKFQEASFNTEINAPDTKPSSDPSGSIFTYSLDDYTVQDFINEVGREYSEETKAEYTEKGIESIEELKTILEIYFRTRTYLGCTHALLELNTHLKPIEVIVILDFDSTNPDDYKAIKLEYCQFTSNDQLYGKHVSHSFPAKYLDVQDMHAKINRLERPDKLYIDFRDVLNNPPDQTTKKLLVQKFDKKAVKQLLYRAKKHNQTGAIQFEPDITRLNRHKAVLEKINGMYLVVGPKPYLQKYFHIGAKQNVAVNGLPTNISLSFPIGALGYLNNVHLILDVDYTLGFGKRNLPGRAKGSIDAFFVDVWGMLRKVVPLVVGQREGVDPSDLASWDKEEQLEIYQDDENKFRQSKLFFKTTPKEEQEVIALFFELIGRKLLKGYFPLRVGANRAVYDALFYIDKDGEDTIASRIKARELKVVEFKFKLSGLLNDLADELKFLEDIDLLVCWENDIKEHEVLEYSIHSLSREGIEPFPGAQLRIQRGTKTCQVLVLKDYLEASKLIASSSAQN